jgi:hypothetical protein
MVYHRILPGNTFPPVQNSHRIVSSPLSINELAHSEYPRRGYGIAVALGLFGTNEHLKEQAEMRVKFVLTMDEVIVDDRTFDQIILDWESDVDQQEIMEVSHKWITTQNFLTNRMQGLTRVGESSLTIEPLEEETDAQY